MSRVGDELHVETAARRRPSIVWIVPLLAIAIALGVAWQNYARQGPLIEVRFADASGVSAGETKLQYRDIAVGQVESVAFSDALDEVIVAIRLDQDMAPFVDENAVFWVVRPEVTAQGVSGLDTVLSGVYIEGDWDGDPGSVRLAFDGLERAPLLSGNQEGTTFVLQSPDGIPAASTPILYRGVEVGQIGPPEISPDGRIISASAVVFAPYDDLVSSATRFWDISGVSFSLGAAGASLDVSSLATLVAGGVTFETLASGGQPFNEDDVFELFPNEETARQRFIVMGETGGLEFQVIFDQNLPGLTVGSAVNLGGLQIGEVTSIAGLTDEARFGDQRVRLVATLQLVPSRIGFAGDADEVAFINFLDQRIQDGLRARLATASILTGGLMVELVLANQQAGVGLDRNADPFPQIPTITANVTDVGASAQGLLQRVDALPIEDVLAGITDFLTVSTALLQSEDLQAVPVDLRAALASIRTVTESDEIAELPGEILALTEDLSEATAQITALLNDAENAALVSSLSETIDRFGITADALPGLIEQTSAVLSEAEALALDDLITQITALVQSADAILAQDSLQTLPVELSAAVGALRAFVESDRVAALPTDISDLVAGLEEATVSINSLLGDVEDAALVGTLTQTIEDFGATAEALPNLAEQASAVLNDVENLALEDLIRRASDLIETSETFLAQDSTKTLPAELNASLAELRRAIAAIQDGGLIRNANATLASTRDAAQAIANASESLPSLSARLSNLANQASAALSDYGRDGTVGRDVSAALSQLEAAAISIDRLARQISRNPNSLLTGR